MASNKNLKYKILFDFRVVGLFGLAFFSFKQEDKAGLGFEGRDASYFKSGYL